MSDLPRLYTLSAAQAELARLGANVSIDTLRREIDLFMNEARMAATARAPMRASCVLVPKLKVVGAGGIEPPTPTMSTQRHHKDSNSLKRLK